MERSVAIKESKMGIEASLIVSRIFHNCLYSGFFGRIDSERIKIVTERMLEYSRIGRNKDQTLTNCNQVIQDIKSSLRLQIEDSQAHIEVGNLPTISVFKEEFTSLLQNLISNAIKYRKREVAPLIKIKAEKLAEFWQFTVEDNGIGIPEEQQERVFTIFQRLHGKEEYEGTDVGLAHCKKIIQLHRGKIWFTSELDLGSTFYFTIKK